MWKIRKFSLQSRLKLMSTRMIDEVLTNWTTEAGYTYMTWRQRNSYFFMVIWCRRYVDHTVEEPKVLLIFLNLFQIFWSTGTTQRNKSKWNTVGRHHGFTTKWTKSSVCDVVYFHDTWKSIDTSWGYAYGDWWWKFYGLCIGVAVYSTCWRWYFIEINM